MPGDVRTAAAESVASGTSGASPSFRSLPAAASTHRSSYAAKSSAASSKYTLPEGVPPLHVPSALPRISTCTKSASWLVPSTTRSWSSSTHRPIQSCILQPRTIVCQPSVTARVSASVDPSGSSSATAYAPPSCTSLMPAITFQSPSRILSRLTLWPSGMETPFGWNEKLKYVSLGNSRCGHSVRL